MLVPSRGAKTLETSFIFRILPPSCLILSLILSILSQLMRLMRHLLLLLAHLSSS